MSVFVALMSVVMIALVRNVVDSKTSHVDQITLMKIVKGSAYTLFYIF